MNRRHWLASAAALALTRAEPLSPIRDIITNNGYCGWPTLARRANGHLVLAWSGNRESHVCPFGAVNYAISKDEGETWSWPRVIMDSDIDDRDAGVLETPKGSLLVTTFTSLAYEAVLERKKDKPASWEAIQRRLDPAARRAMLGCWMLRSTDSGVSWSTPYRVPLNSPHGPVALSDGRLLYVGKDLWGGGRVGVCESTDDGVNWRWLAAIPARTGDDGSAYHELHAVEAKRGRIVVHIRNHNKANAGETLQSESADGGKTWAEPHAIGVWGLPSHLLKLRDGRLVMTYGYRRMPFGNLARVSADAGATWSSPFTISDDGASGDLGYPSTVELSDRSLLTVWYELRSGSTQAILRQRRWKVG
jgi:Neuraminidase (sialidase)